MPSVGADITQPQPSPYNGGKFKLRVEFGLDYPFKAPQVSLASPSKSAAESVSCKGLLREAQPLSRDLVSMGLRLAGGPLARREIPLVQWLIPQIKFITKMYHPNIDSDGG